MNRLDLLKKSLLNKAIVPGTLQTATGSPANLINSLGKPVANYKIYGNSTRTGTPTLEAPIYFTEFGSGNITVTCSNSETSVFRTINMSGHEPLRKVNTAIDYIDYANNRIVRNTAVINLINRTSIDHYSERLSGWPKDGTIPMCFGMGCIGKSGGYNSSYCSHFINRNSASIFDSASTTYGVGNYTDHPTGSIHTTYYRWGVSGVNTPAQFIAWLGQQTSNGTPVLLYYKLAEPIYESISLPKLPTLQGNCSISATDGTLAASNMEISYYQEEVL